MGAQQFLAFAAAVSGGRARRERSANQIPMLSARFAVGRRHAGPSEFDPRALDFACQRASPAPQREPIEDSAQDDPTARGWRRDGVVGTVSVQRSREPPLELGEPCLRDPDRVRLSLCSGNRAGLVREHCAEPLQAFAFAAVLRLRELAQSTRFESDSDSVPARLSSRVHTNRIIGERAFPAQR